MISRKGLTQLRMAARNPRQIARVAGSELKMRAGIPTLRSVEFAVTWICNLKCEFCYAEDLMYAANRPPDMPLDTFEDIMQQAHRLGMIHVNITGGEPLVRKDIFELVDRIPKDVVVSIVTNSTLVTEEKLKRFSEIGVSTIQYSYGSNYDQKFDVDLCRYTRSLGMGVTLSIVNIEAELEHNKRAFELAEEHDFSVLFNYPMRYNNSGLDNEFYWKHRDHPRVREDNMFWSGADRCPAGTHKVYVTNDGDVMTCDRIHGCFGNLYKDSLESIWRKMYDRFKDVKSFCLLETCPEQWAENNQRTGKNYDPSLLGTSDDPFNVFKGTPLEDATVPQTHFTRELLQKQLTTTPDSSDAKPEPASK